MSNLLSERITAMRKERGLTQEQLGQLVGVSAQAVSKWEKGGAPDVDLLPALADRLGVTIDGLFGRDNSPAKDMSQKLGDWLCTFPVEERMNRLMRVLSSNMVHLCALGETEFSKTFSNLFSSSCYSITSSEGQPLWMRSGLSFEQGLCLGIPAEDFPLFLLLPEPAAGYGANLASNEEYRQLFSVLSMEGSLEILRYLYGQNDNYYTTAAVAKRTGLPLRTVERVMEAMEKCHLFFRRTMETENGAEPVYRLHDNYAYVPFLYFAHWFMEENDSWIMGWQDRERPILTPPNAKGDAKIYEKKQ